LKMVKGCEGCERRFFLCFYNSTLTFVSLQTLHTLHKLHNKEIEI
jgi:hypothetical protein